MLASAFQLRAGASVLVLLAALLLATQAAALSLPLDRDLGGVEPDASYATVAVTQNGEDLDFSISLGGLLGPGEDAHLFYFNLVGSFTGLELTASNAPSREYRLVASPRVAGGAGSAFDFGVKLGRGASRRGNGVLTLATFTLSADQVLAPSDLMESSYTSSGIEAEMAVHVQGTSTRGRSVTVGGIAHAPEPSTALLLAAGLAALALRRRRRQR